MRILVVEDEASIASFVARGLEEEGHAVSVAGSLAEAWEALALGDPELLVIDRGLPDGEGLGLVQRLRARGDERPVLMLTARDALTDRVEGLREGADDYLTKPFAFEELLARIAAVSRRVGSAQHTPRVQVGPLTIDLERLRVFLGGDELHLTAQEFKLLRALAEHRGHVLSRTRLLERVWDLHHDPGSNVVDVYISYLRRKLAEAGCPEVIHTVRGRGWVLEERGS